MSVLCVVALFEQAVYYASPDENRELPGVLDALSQGKDPDVSGSKLIWLDSIDSLEIARAGSTDVTIHYNRSEVKTYWMLAFPSVNAREEFLAALRQHYGRDFSHEERDLPLFRATAGPWIVTAVIVLIVGAAAWASAYWTANPPPPPVGKTEQDGFVKFLIWAGPSRILLTGGIAFLASFGWLLKRIIHPPRVQHLVIDRSRALSN